MKKLIAKIKCFFLGHQPSTANINGRPLFSARLGICKRCHKVANKQYLKVL
jgi:hypothetical protein